MLIYDPTGTSKSFRSWTVVTGGSGSLVTLPTDATIAATQPTRIVVQPIPSTALLHAVSRDADAAIFRRTGG